MLENPRTIALQETVAEAFGVKSLQFQTFLLEICLATFTNRKLRSDIVVDSTLDLLSGPETAPVESLDLDICETPVDNTHDLTNQKYDNKQQAK